MTSLMTDNAHSDLTGKLVTVIGGSGFVGRHLSRELLGRGARLRIASRNPQRAYRLKTQGNLGQVQFARCDITRPETLGPVLAGGDAVINLAGAFDGDQGRGCRSIVVGHMKPGIRPAKRRSRLCPSGTHSGKNTTPGPGSATAGQGDLKVRNVMSRTMVMVLLASVTAPAYE